MSGKRIVSGGPIGTGPAVIGLAFNYDDGTFDRIEFDSPVSEAEAALRFLELMAKGGPDAKDRAPKMNKLTKEDIAAIRARADAATPGPWRDAKDDSDSDNIIVSVPIAERAAAMPRGNAYTDYGGGDRTFSESDDRKQGFDERRSKEARARWAARRKVEEESIVLSVSEWINIEDADKAFIIAAREDVPRLLELIDELWKMLDESLK